MNITIPAGTYNSRSVSLTTVTFDRGVLEGTELAVHTSGLGDWPRQETTANGINRSMTTISLSLSVMTQSAYLDIVAYFKSLKGATAITLTYPDASTKEIVINKWTERARESAYVGLQIEAEVVY